MRQGRPGRKDTGGRLVAVIDLEHVERPFVGEGEVGGDIPLADIVEVLVPAAPSDLERCGDPGVTDLTGQCGPLFEEQGHAVGGAVGDDHPMEGPLPAWWEFGIAQKCLHPYFGPVVAHKKAECAVVVGTALETEQDGRVGGAPAVGQNGHPFGAELPRSSPSLVCVVDGLEEWEVGP
jgi:hypothetical protein